jgi:hypothetical protein
VAGAALLAGVGWAVLVHHGLGPRPDLEVHWWSPRGFLTRALLTSPLDRIVTSRGLGLLVFGTPAVLLAAACWLATRSALARAAATSVALVTLLFLFQALGSEASHVAWSLFRWRASATMIALGVVVGAATVSPWLAASWLRRGWAARLAWFLPIAFVVVAVERGVTGTNPRLPFALSPWPVVPVFGLETVDTTIASLLAGVALALLGLAVARTRSRLLGVAGVGLGLTIPAAWLVLGSHGFLPFHAHRRGLLVASAGVAAAVAAAALPRLEPARMRRRARQLGAAALLVGLPLLAGEAWARWDYARNRDVIAQRVIDALQRYYARESTYPDSLKALVASHDLAAVPAPDLGFSFLEGGSAFSYESFGTSYLLEFEAPRWVQCAYNPPIDEEDDGDGGAASGSDDDSGGAWSCPSSPPELW